VLAVARRWLQWEHSYAGAAGGDPTAWQPGRMEYAFTLGAQLDDKAITLAAAEYADGRLDWDDVDVVAVSAATGPAASTAVVQTALPAAVHYPGMPAPRWWQFEDARVDFGGIETAPADLARMLVTEFASIYGNDWYLLPVDLPFASVTVVTSLVVTDTFGDRTLISAAEDTGADDWSLFKLATRDGKRFGGLFLAPVSGSTLDAEPIEDVVLIRDELANLGWAVERTVADAIGRPVDRVRDAGPACTGAPVNDDYEPAAALAYELAASVPEHWIPLLPEEMTAGMNRLVRGAMERVRDGELEPIEPRGRLLLPGRPLALCEEEIPRSGARVTRAYR